MPITNKTIFKQNIDFTGAVDFSNSTIAGVIPVHYATADPTINDDTAYIVGTLWIRTDTNEAWVCTDNTDTAAVWVQIGVGGIAEIVEDTTPQLGGDLDANGNSIGFDNGTGIKDDSGNETLLFAKAASATNFVELTNAANGSAPGFEAKGSSDTDVDLKLLPKGAGALSVAGTTNYENNVTADDDIPNKKYVDDAIGASPGGGSSRLLLQVAGYGSAGTEPTAGALTKTLAGADLYIPYIMLSAADEITWIGVLPDTYTAGAGNLLLRLCYETAASSTPEVTVVAGFIDNGDTTTTLKYYAPAEDTLGAGTAGTMQYDTTAISAANHYFYSDGSSTNAEAPTAGDVITITMKNTHATDPIYVITAELDWTT